MARFGGSARAASAASLSMAGITEYEAPIAGGDPFSIVAGSDGALWIGAERGDMILRAPPTATALTVAGAVRLLPEENRDLGARQTQDCRATEEGQ